MSNPLEQKVYFDLSATTATSGGIAVYAWELCHRLMGLSKPLQVAPFKCPFRTLDRNGIPRTLNAILRDTVWQSFLAAQEGNKADYYIFPSPNPNVPKQFYKRKYAIIIHDLGAWHNPLYLNWRGRRTLQAMPEAVRNAECIFAISEYTAQDVVHEFNVPQKNIIIAPNGLSEIYKREVPMLTQVNGFSIPEKYFLHVGTFEPKKNLLFLLKVYEQFRELMGSAGNPVKLLLTGGESWKSSEFIKYLHNTPYREDILILGRVRSKDLPSLYKSAVSLIFPSTFEGFGLPVIEALSQGTPVLVNSNSSLTQFGKFGATIFTNFDPEGWANELIKIIRSDKRVAQNYISQIKIYFDWDRTAKIVAQSIGLSNF